MRLSLKRWVRVVAIAIVLPAPAMAAEDMARDLTATIALLGLPCGQVVSAQRLKENDYIAVCNDKNRYRVFISAEGRVVAQKQ